jgi:hypothetical protein
MDTPKDTPTETNNKNIYKLDIDRLKSEACEIADLMTQPDNNADTIKKKYKEFAEIYPIIFRNIINKTMSIEEIHVLLDTFNTAQMHFINNTKPQK